MGAPGAGPSQAGEGGLGGPCPEELGLSPCRAVRPTDCGWRAPLGRRAQHQPLRRPSTSIQGSMRPLAPPLTGHLSVPLPCALSKKLSYKPGARPSSRCPVSMGRAGGVLLRPGAPGPTRLGHGGGTRCQAWLWPCHVALLKLTLHLGWQPEQIMQMKMCLGRSGDHGGRLLSVSLEEPSVSV